MIDAITKSRVQRIMQTLNRAADICEISIGTLMTELQREFAIQTRVSARVNHNGMIEVVRTRPRPSEWAKAEKLWAEGDTTMSDIAAMLGVSVAAAHRHMKVRGIKKGESVCAFESTMEAASVGGADEVRNFLGI